MFMLNLLMPSAEEPTVAIFMANSGTKHSSFIRIRVSYINISGLSVKKLDVISADLNNLFNVVYYNSPFN